MPSERIEVDSERKLIRFNIQPQFDQDTIDDCAHVATRSLLAFHGINLADEVTASFHGKSVTAAGFDVLMQKHGLKPILEEINYTNLFEVLRNYGPFLVSLTPYTLDVIGASAASKTEHHTVVVCGVKHGMAIVLIPRVGEKFLKKYEPILNELFGKSNFNSGSFIERIPVRFMKESLKPYYFPSEFTNQPHVNAIEIYNSTKNICQADTRSTGVLFGNSSDQSEPKKKDKLFIVMTLKEKNIKEKGILEAIKDNLNNRDILTKYSYEPFKPSSVTTNNFLYWMYTQKNTLSDIGVVEAAILPEFESKIDSEDHIWSEDFLPYVKLQVFYSVRNMNDDSIDKENNTYRCDNPVYLNQESHQSIHQGPGRTPSAS